MHPLDVKIKSGYFSVAGDEEVLPKVNRISHCTNPCKYICTYLYKEIQIIVGKPAESVCTVIHLVTNLIGVTCEGHFAAQGKAERQEFA